MVVSGEFYAPAALSQGKNPGTHLQRGGVGPIAGLNVLEKRKIFSPSRGSNPGSSSP